jgi:uncharacterized protein (TIGR02302 family)
MVGGMMMRHPMLHLGHLMVRIEHAARILWAPASIVMLFVAVAAFDVLPMLPPWLHALIVICFAMAFAGSLRTAVLSHRPPSRVDAMRRIERDSGLTGRPFDALHDTPVTSDPVALALWQVHQARSRSLLRRLRLGLPRAGLSAQDRRAWRSLALLLLAIGLFTGSDHLGDKLDAALSPRILGEMPARDVTLDVWVTPPAYTGLSPIVLSRGRPEGNGETVEIPEGSTIEARVSGGPARPHLEIAGKRLKFAAVDRHNFTLSTIADAGTSLKVTQGWRTLAEWPISIATKVSPVIAWTAPPSAGDHARVKLEYTAADQYGLATVSATVELAEEVRPTMLPAGTALDKPDAAKMVIPLPDLAGHPKSIKSNSQEDWTSNPWAGFPVHITLAATGVSGLSGSSEAQDMILPERKFTDPIAKMIIDERKRLTLDPVANRIDAATKLAAIDERPELYGGDTVTFLVLRTAAIRLWRDTSLAELPDIQDMLWQVAVRLEDGGRDSASRAVSEAAEALKQALHNGAPQSEIARLSNNLKQAMNNYMDHLQRELARRLARGEQVPMASEGSRTIDRNDLNGMLDKMQGLARGGDRSAAEDMLSQMEDMMRDLRMAEQARPNSRTQQAYGAMRDLRNLMQKQQSLNDQTYQRSQGLQTQSGDEARQQQDLRKSLEQTMSKLQGLGAKMPESLKQSDQAMGGAAGRLGQQDYPGAIPQQRQALDQLREGMKDLQQQMSKDPSSGLAAGEGEGDKPDEQDRDPFGRKEGGTATDDQRVRIPDEDTQQRSREVLEELRRRDGDRFRPRTEHDYIDRLLQDY